MARSTAGTKGVPRVDRESQILEVAALAFGTHGYSATSVVDVADRAGISKPLVYNYFGSKDGLYLACIEQVGTLLAEEMERVARHDAVGLQRGINTLEAMFELLEDRRHLWRIMIDPTAPTTGPIAAATSTFTVRIDRLAREGVSEMLAAGGVTDELDVEAMVRVWLGIVDSLMAWWVVHPDETAKSMTRRCERLVASLFAGADA